VRDKDIFFQTYGRLLGRRLLKRLSVSTVAEGNMIAKLTLECGQFATQSLSSMLTDMTLSDQLHKEYCKLSHEGSPHGIAHETRLLRGNAWSLQDEEPGVPCVDILACARAFEAFYFPKFSSRRITWIYSMGTADISTCCLGKRYILTVSTYQCLILMLFNDQRRLAFEDICEATRIPKNECKRQLVSMSVSRHKLLIQEPPGKRVEDSTCFVLNDSFASDRMKVVVSIVKKEEKIHEKAAIQEPAERKHVLDATIVRIMKSRKQLDHNTLMEEVFRHCTLFRPQPPQIKTHIEHLIEREFIKRDQQERNVYIYVP
jgi:cullin 3